MDSATQPTSLGVITNIMPDELNYCQIKSHYNFDENSRRFLHRGDTQETKDCLEEQFRLRKIGRYAEQSGK
jgi:hypothetical protein